MAVVQLKSSDGEIFKVDEAVAAEYFVKAKANEAEGSCCPVELKVSSKILAKVIDYCEYHAADPKMGVDKDGIKAKWDEDFVDVDDATLYDLVMAAKGLGIESLLELTCMTVANIIKGMTTEEVRLFFGIKNDFTPEEEAKIKEENSWAFNLNSLKDENNIPSTTQSDPKYPCEVLGVPKSTGEIKRIRRFLTSKMNITYPELPKVTQTTLGKC